MIEIGFGIGVFACLSAAFLLALHGQHHLPPHHLSDESLAVVRLGIGVIATLSALVLSLVITTVQGSFHGAQRDLRIFSGHLILLDHELRAYGTGAAGVRAELGRYTEQAIRGTWGETASRIVDDPQAAALLSQLEDSIVVLPRVGTRQAYHAGSAQAEIMTILLERQQLIADDAAAIPPVFLGLLTFWLAILFASFGYRAPANALVTTTVLLVAGAVSSAIFLLVEMDGAFVGLIRVSDQPLRAALTAIRAQ